VTKFRFYVGALGKMPIIDGSCGTHPKFLPAPESPYAILMDENKIHFITSAKPFNWIQTVDLEQLGGPKDLIDALYVSDPKSDPKVVVSLRRRQPDDRIQATAELFAVNVEGHCFAPELGGRGWRRLPGLEPYHRVAPPSPIHDFVSIVAASDGGDDLLIVHSRKAQTKALTHEEILAAAEKFLMPADLQPFRQELVVHLGDMESAMNNERHSKGVTDEIKTVADWKRLLPDSYEVARRDCEDGAFISLRGLLLSPLKSGGPLSPDKYHNIDEYRVWLTQQAIGPETRFTLLRGNVETAWEVAASLARDPFPAIPGGPAAFRSTKTTTTIIFAGDTSTVPESAMPELFPEKRLPGFFLLGPAAEAR
jgi:hypothetical protein